MVVPSLIVVRLATITARAFVGVVSEFSAFATLVLAYISALVSIVTVLAAVFTVVFLPLGSLRIGRGV